MIEIQKNTAYRSTAEKPQGKVREGSGSPPRSVDSAPQSAPPHSASDHDWETLYRDLEIYALERNFQLKFSVDEDTGRTVIKIINSDTHKIVREIPPEEMLRVAASLEQLAKQIIDTEA